MQPPQAPPNSPTHKLGLPKSPPPLLLIFGLDYGHGAVLERISVGFLERIWQAFLLHNLGFWSEFWWGFLE